MTLRLLPVWIWIDAIIFGAAGLFVISIAYMTTLTCNRIESCNLETSKSIELINVFPRPGAADLHMLTLNVSPQCLQAPDGDIIMIHES